MNKTIWKFKLEATGYQKIEMPIGAEILTIQIQIEIPHLWVLVDPEAEKETRHFEIFGTGHSISSDMGSPRTYIGTYQLIKENLVFHVFES